MIWKIICRQWLKFNWSLTQRCCSTSDIALYYLLYYLWCFIILFGAWQYKSQSAYLLWKTEVQTLCQTSLALFTEETQTIPNSAYNLAYVCYTYMYISLLKLQLFFVLQTTLGHCFQKNNTVQIIDDCDIPEAPFIQELVFFFSPKSKRIMVR